MMAARSYKPVPIILFTVILAYYTFNIFILEGRRDGLENKRQQHGVWNLSPLALSALAGEFKGILSSYIVLDAGAQIGNVVARDDKGNYVNEEADYDCRNLATMLNASQYLDPSFQQTYMVAHGWLPWEKCKLVKETNKILQVARENRPWDLFPINYLAFNHYYHLGNYQKAGEILLAAAQEKDAPQYLAILGSRLSKKGGHVEAAIALLQSVLNSKGPDEPGYTDLEDRLAALRAVAVLDKAVANYHGRFASYPVKPEQLIDSGILTALPENPYNLSFCINQEGEVFFDRPDCRRQN